MFQCICAIITRCTRPNHPPTPFRRSSMPRWLFSFPASSSFSSSSVFLLPFLFFFLSLSSIPLFFSPFFSPLLLYFFSYTYFLLPLLSFFFLFTFSSSSSSSSYTIVLFLVLLRFCFCSLVLSLFPLQLFSLPSLHLVLSFLLSSSALWNMVFLMFSFSSFQSQSLLLLLGFPPFPLEEKMWRSTWHETVWGLSNREIRVKPYKRDWASDSNGDKSSF